MTTPDTRPLPSLEELETRRRRSRARAQRRRVRRIWSGLIMTLALSAGIGVFFGLRSRPEPGPPVAERGQLAALHAAVARETNRVLLEIFRPRDVRARPAPR